MLRDRGSVIALSILAAVTVSDALAKPIVTDTDKSGGDAVWFGGSSRDLPVDCGGGSSAPKSDQTSFSDQQAVYLSTLQGKLSLSPGGTHQSFSLDWQADSGFDGLGWHEDDTSQHHAVTTPPSGPKGGYEVDDPLGKILGGVVASATESDTGRCLGGGGVIKTPPVLPPIVVPIVTPPVPAPPPVAPAVPPVAVPEVGTLALLAGGLALLRWRSRR